MAEMVDSPSDYAYRSVSELDSLRLFARKHEIL